jgi:hypothetical protein
MPRKFITVDYETTLDQLVSLRECLPPEHLCRFIAKVITELDLSDIYGAYGNRGGTAIAPQVLQTTRFITYFWRRQSCCDNSVTGEQREGIPRRAVSLSQMV